MLTRILWAALVAGLVAGIATSVLQHFTTTPLILEAERYESGEAAAALAQHLVFVHGHEGHAEATGAWSPADGLERTLATSVVTIGTAFGFALILLSAMILAGERITARSGLLWGLAGFVAAGLAPSLGLSAELPGSAAAALGARQLWWVGTALATAGGLWLALRVSRPWAIGAGIALMVLPHLIGAPHPEGYVSAVPSELAAEFAAASLVVLAVCWTLAGTVAGYVWQRGEEKQSVPATA